MKKVTNNILKGMASRFSATVMLLAMGCIAAFAQGNKLYIEDFYIAPGETKPVEIKMSNENLVSSLQFDLEIDIQNSSLEYIDNSLAKDGKRLTPKGHTVLIKQMGSDKGWYRVQVLSESSTIKDSYIKDNSESETILTFQVKAADNFKEGSINITKVIGSDGTVEDPIDVKFEEQPSAKVEAYVGNADIIMDSSNVRPQLFQIPVSLDNIVEVAGLQAKVTLPAGVFIAEDENGEQVVLNNDRVSENVRYSIPPVPNEEGSYTLLISALTGELFSGNTGELFTLNLMANNDFIEGEIVISDIVISTKYGYSYDIDPVSVTVKAVSDPSGDGVWDLKDATAVKLAILNSDVNSDYDVNGDGVVNLADYTATVLKVMAQ